MGSEGQQDIEMAILTALLKGNVTNEMISNTCTTVKIRCPDKKTCSQL